MYRLKYIHFIFFLIFFSIGILYKIDYVMFDMLDRVEGVFEVILDTEEPLRINGIRNQLFKLVDEVNILRSNKKLMTSDLFSIKIDLSPQDIHYFETALKSAINHTGHVLPLSALDKRTVDVIYNGTQYTAKMWLHGDAYNHYGFYKKSFKMRFADTQIPERYKDWRLLIPDDRGYFSPFVSNFINTLIGLPHIEHRFAKVYINDIFYGIYYTEEKYDEKYLEKNRLSNHVIIKFDNIDLKNNAGGSSDIYAIDEIDELALDNVSTSTREEVVSVIDDFFDAINQYDIDEIGNYLDIDMMGKFEAWRVILGKSHDVIAGNTRFAYNMSSGKFFIIPRLESEIHSIDDTYMIEDNVYKFIRENRDIQETRNKYLATIIAHKQDIFDYYEQLMNEYYSFIISDNTISRGSRQRKKTIEDNIKEITYNISYWETYLENYQNDIRDIVDTRESYASLSIGKLRFFRHEDRFILPAGTYYVTEDMILPKGYQFVFSAGVRLFLNSDVSFISYSPIHIEGLSDNKVYIGSAVGSQHFGVFAIQGIDSNSCRSTINHLDISQGSEAFVNNVFYSGGLNIYNCDVEINNSYIHDNTSDDGLNVKYGTILLNNNIFKNNAADQVDLDYAHGEVRNNVFLVEQTNSNGDGLDVSGSDVRVSDNMFENFEDKGLSVGEESSIYVFHNTFTSNTMAIAIKDLSDVYIDKNDFFDNIMDINAYQKKYIFGGGNGFLLKGQNLIIDTDDKSVVKELSEVEIKNIVEEKFYGI